MPENPVVRDGDESPAFEPGSPVQDGIGPKLLGWTRQFRQCIALMHGKHAILRKNANVLLKVFECTQLVNPDIAGEIEIAKDNLRTVANPKKKAHMHKQLRDLLANQGISQYRGIMRTIGFLEKYVEKKFPIADNVTVKVLHVLEEVKHGLQSTQTSEWEKIVVAVMGTKSTFSGLCSYAVDRGKTATMAV